MAGETAHLLREIENSVYQLRTHRLELVYLMGNEQGLRHKINQFLEENKRASFLIEGLQLFLEKSPHLSPDYVQDLTQVLEESSKLLVYYQQMIEFQLDELDIWQMPHQEISVVQQHLLRIASGENTELLTQLSEDVKTQILVAQEHERQAVAVLKNVIILRGLIIFGSLLISGVVAVILAVYTSRGIARPLEKVTQVAKEVTESSNFSLRVPVITEDEVGILARALNHLIQGMADYTLELQATQTQLIQTEKMSSLGQMVAGVAHEINNPLNFIIANLDYIERYCSDLLTLISLYQEYQIDPSPRIKNHLEVMEFEFMQQDLWKILDSMKVGSERIEHLVISLRNFSHLDQSERKRIDLHQGIEDTLIILSHRLKAGIQVIKNYQIISPIECYPASLNQVFMNLINNAIDVLEIKLKEHKSMEIPTLWIETRQLGMEQVEIRIRDNGPGISPAIQNKIFDPFFTTKPVGKGTGLGMAISYQIITKHKGQLYLNSEYKQGAELIIILPINATVTTAVNHQD